MAEKSIIWSLRANSELKEILKFYIQRNGNTKCSLKLLKRIENILNILSTNESIGRLTADKKTRVIVLKVFLIFYEIKENRIEILSFWDNRQDEIKRIDL
ncbi:MAG: type II toxin-antitoxin system RelE/ParE family toxin [Bacteroidales bacterium]|nr:type II toxin-antitoxin system RelE/ParE family toxin [Bacteroidales bacterium]